MHKDTYNHRKQQGLCPLCGKPPQEGRVRCAECIIKENAKAREGRRHRRKRGLCSKCGKLNPRGGWQCEGCYAKQRRNLINRTENYKERQLCSDCGEARAAGSRLCDKHKQARKVVAKRLWKQRVANRQCVQCGYHLKPDWSQITCEKCAYRARLKIEKRRRVVVERYGGRCSCCGELCFYFLTLDHVLENGAEERKNGRSQNRIWAELSKSNVLLPEYQILCYNCNCAKGVFGSCPHTWEDPDTRPMNAIRKGKANKRLS